MRAKKIIKEHCKSILWGVNDSKYNKDIENEDKKEVQFKEFKKFIESNPNELLFLKTFMIDCFKKSCFCFRFMKEIERIFFFIKKSIYIKISFKKQCIIFKPFKAAIIF